MSANARARQPGSVAYARGLGRSGGWLIRLPRAAMEQWTAHWQSAVRMVNLSRCAIKLFGAEFSPLACVLTLTLLAATLFAAAAGRFWLGDLAVHFPRAVRGDLRWSDSSCCSSCGPRLGAARPRSWPSTHGCGARAGHAPVSSAACGRRRALGRSGTGARRIHQRVLRQRRLWACRSTSSAANGRTRWCWSR